MNLNTSTYEKLISHTHRQKFQLNKLFTLLALTAILQSCSSNEVDLKNYFNQERLISQSFEINSKRDTTLVTKAGIILKIKKGDITSNEKGKVTLIIKEALSIYEMISGGLVTQNNNQPLSSGGMVYINGLPGSNITFNRAIEVLVPTENYNRDMLIYKGEEKNDRVNWRNPVAMPENETTNKILAGELLFQNNCSNCHKISKDYTGPTLLGITERRPKQWLYEFTRNPSRKINSISSDNLYNDEPDYYSACLFKKWKPTVMTGFPNFSDSTLDAIFSYIKSESDKNPNLISKTTNCCDSCATIMENRNSQRKKTVVKEKVNLNRTVTIPSNVQESSETNRTQNVTKTFYSMEIDAAGWYNIDILLKELDGCLPSELTVYINEKNISQTNVILVIPSIKVFLEASQVKSSNEFVFNDDKNILLPHGATSYIFAFNGTGEKILFGKATFTAAKTNIINLSLSPINSKEILDNLIMLGLKESEKQLKVKSEIGKVDSLYFKDCNCDPTPQPSATSPIN